MKNKLWKGLLVFLIVVSFFMAIGTLVISFKWINKSFPGFLLYNNQMISQTTLPNWYDKDNPQFNFLDKVIAVDGYKVDSSLEVSEIISNKQPGQSVQILLLRNNEFIHSEVTVKKFTLSDYMQTFGIQLFVGLVILLTGLFVFRLKPDLLSSHIILLLCISLGNWFIIDVNYLTSYSFIYDLNYSYMFQVFVPAFFVLLAFVFPEPKKYFVKRYWIAFIPILFSLALFLVQLFYRNDQIIWPMLDTIVWISTAVGALFLTFSLSWDYFKAKNLLFKKRAQVGLLGTLIGFFAPAALGVLIITYGYENISLLTIPVLFFPISLAYAIVKHKLFDIHVIIQKALVYGLSSGAVAAIFILPIFLFNLMFSTENLWKNPVYLLFLSIALVFVVNPLQNIVQRFIDTIFFRKKIDYAKTFTQFGDKLSSLLSMEEISSELMYTINKSLFVEKAFLFIKNKETGNYLLNSTIPQGEDMAQESSQKIEGKNILVEFLYGDQKEIFVEDVITEKKYAERRIGLLKTFADYSSSLIVPLFFKSDLLGILFLGNKKSGQMFTTEEIIFAKTIANQGAISLENSFSFELVQDYADEVEEKNKQLKNVQAQLIQAEKMSAIGHLASGIAHEIRNPLNIIEGARYYLSSLFSNGSEDGVAQEYLEYIQNEVIRTNRLIDSLLDFSKFKESNIENININNVIENVLILSRKQLSDSNIKIKKNLDEKLPILKGDSNQLWQVVINLLMNSVQAINSIPNMDVDGEIVVESGIYSKSDNDQQDHLYLKVMDNGCGIREKDLSSIFDPFYTNKPEGTGLGLSVSYKIVESHSGSMLVTSEVGIGTSFMVELPVINRFSGEEVNGQKENLNS